MLAIVFTCSLQTWRNVWHYLWQITDFGIWRKVSARTSPQDITEGNTHSAEKVYQSPRHVAERKEIILQTLRWIIKLDEELRQYIKVQTLCQTN